MGKQEKKWKYAVNTNSFPADRPYGEIVRLLCKLRVDGVEWGLPALEKAERAAREMAQLSRDNGLEIAGFLNGGNLCKTNVMRRWSEIVAGAGGKSLRVAPLWVAWDFRESVHQRDSFVELFKRTRAGLEKLVPLWTEYRVRYVIEMHPGHVASSAALSRQLLEGLDPRAVGVIYDPANGLAEGHIRPRQAVEILGPYLAYLHAKNLVWKREKDLLKDKGSRRAKWSVKTCSLDKGILDWVEVYFALNVCGFKGWLALEEFFRKAPVSEIADGVRFLKQASLAAATEISAPFTTFND